MRSGAGRRHWLLGRTHRMTIVPKTHEAASGRVVIRKHRFPDGWIVERYVPNGDHFEFLNNSVKGWAAFASVYRSRRIAKHALKDWRNGVFGNVVREVMPGSD